MPLETTSIPTQEKQVPGFGSNQALSNRLYIELLKLRKLDVTYYTCFNCCAEPSPTRPGPSLKTGLQFNDV